MDSTILINDKSLPNCTCGSSRTYALIDNVFDMLTVGIACVRRSGDLMYVNRPALAMLDRCGILTTKLDHLNVGRQISDLALKKLCLDISHTVVIRRKNAELQVQVEPFDSSYMNMKSEKERRSGAMLILRELGNIALPSIEQLKSLYGLTQAEARLALALCSGDTVSEYAQSLEITVATVRTHLRAVMEKTGSQRQAQLLTILFSAPSTSFRHI